MKRKTDWLKVAAKLGKFSAEIGNSASARRDTQTIAGDFPEAWRELQKRRRVMTWSIRLSVLGIAGGVLARASDSWLYPDRITINESSAAPLLLFVSIGLVLIASIETKFRCPRCGKYFTNPASRRAEHVLSSSTSECEHCHLRIGEEPR